MARINRHFPANQPNDSDKNPQFDEERPLHSVTTEDIFDKIIAGLINRPDIAPKEPSRVRLPSVEDFRLEKSAAINMASKFVPDQKPRIKSRRPRYSSPNRDRRRFPDEQNDGHDADHWDPPQAIAAPRGSVRGSFWSICASLLIVLSTSAAFAAIGFVQPLNDLLPQRMADFLSDINEDLGASLLNRADTSADFEVAGDKPASIPRPVSPDQPMATSAVAHAVSKTSIVFARPEPTTAITAEVRPSANSGGSGFVKQAELPGTTSEKAFALGATVLELGKIDGAEFATSKSVATRSAAPAATPAAAAPAEAPDQVNKYAPRKTALQRSVKADPLKVTNTTPQISPPKRKPLAKPGQRFLLKNEGRTLLGRLLAPIGKIKLRFRRK